MGLDLIVSLGGLIVPPVFDFIKKKFIKSENDTPERTIGSLATTKPDILPQYVEALSKLKDSEVKFFNRDVIGQPSLWVVNLRAAIRPITVVVGLIALLCSSLEHFPYFGYFQLHGGTRLFFEAVIASWFGSRLKTGK